MLAQEDVLSGYKCVVDALAAHRLWLRTEGKDGLRADFTGADLRSVPLSACDLRHAKMIDCRLDDVSLAGTNLESADLSGASLVGASLPETNLKHAKLDNVSLEGADLSLSKFLKAGQLCGCNLSHAKLPPGIEFHGLEQANQSASRLAVQFVSMLSLCLYSWLTIGSTKDVDLLTNARSVAFPFVNLTLPILAFYLLVPVALPALSTAFYIHLSKYWDSVASLPAFFPDGSEVTARTTPMLLDRFVELYMVRLRPIHDTFTNRLYVSLMAAGLYGIVPVTLFAFWLRYLSRHDAIGTSVQLVFLLGFLIYTWFLNISMKVKLQLTTAAEVFSKRRWPLYLCLAACVGLSALSYAALYGSRLPIDFFYADLAGQEISSRSKAAADGVLNVPGANLADMNLRHANLADSFAMNADFSRSTLEHTNLNGATLNDASLRDADLHRATMYKAQLHGADLRRARLSNSNLGSADLVKANLTRANLEHSNLSDARVSESNFSRANLTGGVNAHGINGQSADFALALMEGAQMSRVNLPRGDFFLADLRHAHLWKATLDGSSFILADLTSCNLTQANLTDADFSQANLREAVLEGATLINVKLICAQLYDALLTGADLTGADLTGAQLRGAVLRNARMTRTNLTDALLEAADLQGTDLRGVDLSHSSGLTRSQLVNALIDSRTLLPPDLDTQKSSIVAESEAAHRRSSE
jgi:uncharacterized protein YjbI with pentapeptide repeats